MIPMQHAIHEDDKRTEQPAEPAEPMREGERHLATAMQKLRRVKEQMSKPPHRITDPQ